MSRIVIGLALALLLLSGCQSTPEPADKAPPLRFGLLPPAAMTDYQIRLQRVDVTTEQGQHTLLFNWQSLPGKLTVAAMTGVGLPVFSLVYDGNLVQAKRQVPLPRFLYPERMVADLQWAYWPLNQIRQHLAAGYTIIEHSEHCLQGVLCRQMWLNNELVSEVDYLDPQRNQLVLTDARFGYQLRIETLEISP